MVALWLSRASRRLYPSLSSSFSLSQSIFHLTTNPTPNPPFNYPNRWISDFQFSRENSKFTHTTSSFNLNQYAGISTSSSSSGVAEAASKNDGNESTKGGSKKAEVSWIDLYLPKKVLPYAQLARLDKPIGTWLLAWPCMWSITMAAPPGSVPDFKMMTLFSCGALLLRGAGCTINDLLDRDIDAKVERTKLRPVASGLLTPFQGLCFLGFQLLLGLGILLQLNNYS